MFKKFFLLLILITLISLPGKVLALTTSQNTTAAANQSTRMAQIKSRADAEIQKRITSLNGLVAKIGSLKRLSDSDKANYTSQIQTDISGLTSLQAKIDADTDLTTLKTDAQTIFSQFRVYAVFMPEINLLSASETMSVITDQLSQIAVKLQGRINVAKSNGKNVDSLQTLLTDMQAKIADAKTQYQQVQTTLTGVTPQGWPGNQPTLQSARNSLKTGALDLKTARQDAQTIWTGLKGLATTVATPSAHN